MAQFLAMKDAEKLSRPAFEPQHAGIELSSSGSQPGIGVDGQAHRALRRDHHRQRVPPPPSPVPADVRPAVRPFPRRQQRRAQRACRLRASSSSTRSPRRWSPAAPPTSSRRRPTTARRQGRRPSPAKRRRWTTSRPGGRRSEQRLALQVIPAFESERGMNPIGTYSFLPWLRRGLTTAAAAAAPGPSARRWRSTSMLHADQRRRRRRDHAGRCTATSQLYGPGDVVGLDARAIVRTEPRAWITNFEPNYLAVRRVLRRGPAVALHARCARRTAAPGAVAHAARARRGRIRRRHAPPASRCRTSTSSDPACFPRPPTCGPGRTCT